MMSLAIASVAMVSYAQETVSEVVVPTLKNSVITNSFGSNWFVGANLGVQMYNGVITRGESMFDHLTPAASLYVGKWHTPGFGWRLGYKGWEVKPYDKGDEVSYSNFHFDALFNLSNMICGYNETRIWNAIPYLGFGYAVNWDGSGADGSKNRGSMSADLGWLNTFRIAKHWAISLDLSATAFKKAFADAGVEGVTGNGYDLLFAAEVGVVYKFNKVGWENTPDVDAIMAMNAAALAELNTQLQAKESESANLKTQLTAAKNALSQAQTRIKQLENEPDFVDVAQSVFFAFNSSKIASKKEIINLQSLADAAKNSGVKLSVVGYADSATGSAAYNQKLSEARANAVAEKLVELGVPQSQLVVEGKGGVAVEKPAKFNRRVIISIVK